MLNITKIICDHKIVRCHTVLGQPGKPLQPWKVKMATHVPTTDRKRTYIRISGSMKKICMVTILGRPGKPLQPWTCGASRWDNPLGSCLRMDSYHIWFTNSNILST